MEDPIGRWYFSAFLFLVGLLFLAARPLLAPRFAPPFAPALNTANVLAIAAGLAALDV
jgi:hypothetical protein